jgi:hypothetical protein
MFGVKVVVPSFVSVPQVRSSPALAVYTSVLFKTILMVSIVSNFSFTVDSIPFRFVTPSVAGRDTDAVVAPSKLIGLSDPSIVIVPAQVTGFCSQTEFLCHQFL